MTRRSPPWLVGLCYLPFGFYTGFLSTALPLLLTARGVTLDRVAVITFVAMLPTFSSFVITPVVDCGIPRKTWALLLGLVTALSIGGAAFLLDARHQVGLMVVMVVGSLSAQMYGSTMGGLIPSLVEERQQGSVSGWLNVAYLSGAALFGMVGIFALQQWSAMAAAALLACLVMAPVVVLQVLGDEERVPRPARDVVAVGLAGAGDMDAADDAGELAGVPGVYGSFGCVCGAEFVLWTGAGIWG